MLGGPSRAVIQRPEPRLVLASASAARRAVLAAAGLSFAAEAAAVDEAAIKESARAEGIPAAEAAIMLAEAKAQRIARAAEPDALVIGADQLLVCDGAWFDKPPDRAAARAQLLALRGRTHALVTAVVCWRGGERIWGHVEAPRLTMRDFSDASSTPISRRRARRCSPRSAPTGWRGSACSCSPRSGASTRHPRPAVAAAAGLPARARRVAGVIPRQ